MASDAYGAYFTPSSRESGASSKELRLVVSEHVCETQARKACGQDSLGWLKMDLENLLATVKAMTSIPDCEFRI